MVQKCLSILNKNLKTVTIMIESDAYINRRIKYKRVKFKRNSKYCLEKLKTYKPKLY